MKKLFEYVSQVSGFLKEENTLNIHTPVYEYSKNFLQNDFKVQVFPNVGGATIKVVVNENERSIDIDKDTELPVHFGLIGVNIQVKELSVGKRDVNFNFLVDVIVGTGFLSKKIKLLNTPISFEKEKNEGSEAENLIEPQKIEENTTPKVDLKMMKFFSLINLIKADGKIEKEEIAFFESAIDVAFTDDDVKLDLIKKINSDETFEVNYEVFKDSPETAINLLITLVELAKRDGKIPLAERIFIKTVGKKMGFTEEDITEVIEGT